MSDSPAATMKKNPSYSVALSLIFTPELEEVGYTVTCKEFPELITYGQTLDEVFKNAGDAFNAVFEAYEELRRDLPESTKRYHKAEPDNALDLLIEAAVPMKIPQQPPATATQI
ncbi:MAG: type II toxin-antitoxin system HicB family antitoxin [Candidatus Poribacteria bacterium]|nr:type II toxin-antitoxin system HicB family antitoxin [Candidatus Poribacteria bacterium]MDE0505920.1 type II toxin-antitoxin system HicB family antitoxin [Candidatus Poribacteria bacterium]